MEELKTEPVIRSFQINRDAIADLKRPEIDQYADVKARVALLESIVLFQDRMNPLNIALSDDLNVDLFKIEAKILEAVALNQNKAARDMEELRRHYDHRFDLQIADNLRNVQHISSLKTENNHLRRRLEITTKKLQRLQTEFDGGEIGDMEQSAEEIAEADSFANISFNFNAAARRGTSHI